MKKKIFAPLLGAVVLGLSAYAGYRTYDAYAGNSEDDLLLANAEALAIVEFMGCNFNRITHPCTFQVTGDVEMKLLKVVGVKVNGDGTITVDGEVVCQRGGNTCCTMVECVDVYRTLMENL